MKYKIYYIQAKGSEVWIRIRKADIDWLRRIGHNLTIDVEGYVTIKS